MDKRSWPWRKKMPERLSSPSDTAETMSSFPSSRYLDYQDDTTPQWQESEEMVRILNDKLSAALLDAVSKDLLAKQHAKLAEEAVSGWETAEAEAASLKKQLEATVQQKVATEDRVSHLDGALKECMRQLRNVREEQEENIHKAITKKTRDWDKKHSELEEKYADLEQRYLEKDAESRAMSRSLQERARSICEISDTCSKAQTKASMLQVRLESVEKEKAAFRYELNVTKKELEIRNVEKGLSRRAADAASKQHMEDTKRIAKLEAVCQSLHTLLRKKLPGSGAITQMKLKIDGLGSEKKDVTRKSPKGVISLTDPLMQQASVQEDNNQEYKEAAELWSEQYSSLEEETKMLRESLIKRNNELQSARLMCARTASKLSNVEQQLESLKGNQNTPMVLGLEMLTHTSKPSLTSVSEDGNYGEASCAESWASALIAELDQFKKVKSTLIISEPLDMSKTDLDDFIEMERLASCATPDSAEPKQRKINDQEKGAAAELSLHMVPESNTLSGGSLVMEADIRGVCAQCVEITSKLAAAKEELARTAAEQASLKEKVRSLFEESADVAEVLEQINVEVGLPGPLLEHMGSLLCHGCCPDEMPEHEITRQQSFLTLCAQDVISRSSEANDTIRGTVAGLTLAVCEVAWLVDEVKATSSMENPCPAFARTISALGPASAHIESSHGILQLPEGMQFRNQVTDARCQKLVEVSNTFLIGKVELAQLMVEVAATLGHITDVKSPENYASRSVSRKCSSCKRSIHTSSEIVVGSPMSDTSKSECSDAAAKIVPADDCVHTLGKDSFSSEVLRLEEELRKVVAEKLALETHMNAEYERFSEVEEELNQLKAAKKDMESTLKMDREEAERLKGRHHKAEEMVSSLQMQLASAESTKLFGEEKLLTMAASKEELGSQLHICKAELSNLRAQMTAVTEEVSNERERSSDLKAKCEELQDQLERSILRCPRCAMAAGEAEQTSRASGIAAAAEKLAECERMILVLRHQLKVLASSGGSPHQDVHGSLAFDRAPPPNSHGSFRRCPSTEHDCGHDGGNSARFSDDPRDHTRHNACGRSDSARHSEARDFVSSKKEPPWDPWQSIASDLLDSELISLSLRGQQASGRNMFGQSLFAHEDYIEAVAQMPSSPETSPEVDPVSASLKRLTPKRPRRKSRSPRSFVGVDMTKSMNDASSPSGEKQNRSSLTKFFSRARSDLSSHATNNAPISAIISTLD